jgi:hypothetical protein
MKAEEMREREREKPPFFSFPTPEGTCDFGREKFVHFFSVGKVSEDED